MPFYGQYTGFGGGAPVLSLIDIITGLGLTTGLELCLDAGDANSYTSGQQWLDTSGRGYDMNFGVSASAASDDPTFNGVAGGLSSAEYMSFDGGDLFQYDSANETWMNNLHKNNANFTILMAHFIPTGASGGFLFGTNTGGAFAGIGLTVEQSATEILKVRVRNGGSTSFEAITTDANTENAWNINALDIDEATGSGGGFLWRNGAYMQVASADTFDATYSSPSTSAATAIMDIGDSGGALDFPLPSGSRVALFAAWSPIDGANAAARKANLDRIWTEISPRFAL